jgi:hypothetical protein
MASRPNATRRKPGKCFGLHFLPSGPRSLSASLLDRREPGQPTERIRERVGHGRLLVAISDRARVAHRARTPAVDLAPGEDVVAVLAHRNRGDDQMYG